MPAEPWWLDRVDRLLTPAELSTAAGPLWHLSERLQFIRENVEPALLQLDFAAVPRAEVTWAAFTQREADVSVALEAAVSEVASRMRSGQLGPVRFRAEWEHLGFEQNAEGAGTPADDYLDAVSGVPRMAFGDARPASGMLNLSSRAQRIADFLLVTEPGRDDCVIDVGSGSGKFSLTVAASTPSTVCGIEYAALPVEQARRSADALGLDRLSFQHGDVRDANLAQGTIFYLYFPFQGAVAQTVAETLGQLAREREIVVYLSGPIISFAEHFLREVDRGAFKLSERRGEFSEVLVFHSARP